MRIRTYRLVATLTLLLLLAPATAGATVQTRDDPSDAPHGASGKADLRTVAWDVTGSSAKLTVSVDASTFNGSERALIGVHVLMDRDSDSIADDEVVATRNVDGLNVDVSLRSLDGTSSAGDCQDLAGKAVGPQDTVTPDVRGRARDLQLQLRPDRAARPPGDVPLGRLRPGAARRRAGPWDVMPDAANPDPGAANPGDRSCAAKSGLRVRMKTGVAFPDPAPRRTPTPTPPRAQGPPPKPVVVLALPGGQPQAGTPATIDAGGHDDGPGTHVVAYEWDMNGDGHVDTNTGTNPIAHVMTGAAAQTVIVHATDSNFNSATATMVLNPGRPPANCVPEESIGVLRIRAACIRREGDTIVADPEPSERYWENFVVSLNGVSLVTRDPRATVSFNVSDREIVAHGRFRVMLLNAPGGDITLFESGADGFSWPLPSGAGTAGGEPASIFSIEAARSCTGSDENGGAVQARCAEVPGGFPIVGMIALGIDTDTFEATLDVNVRVGTPLEVTGRTRLRASAVLGLVLDSVGFGIANAELGPVTVDRLAFVYEPPGRGSPPHEGSMWDVAMEISFTTPPFSVAGRMIFLDGQLQLRRRGRDVQPRHPHLRRGLPQPLRGALRARPDPGGRGPGRLVRERAADQRELRLRRVPRRQAGDARPTATRRSRAASSRTSTWTSGATASSATAAGSATPIRRSRTRPSRSSGRPTTGSSRCPAGQGPLPGRRRPRGPDSRRADRLDARLHQQRLGGRLRARHARHAQLPHRL